MQQNFPIASVINAAQQNAVLQQRAREQGNQDLIQGLQSIGQVGTTLIQRRQQMAQALAGAKMYANTPEGQQMLTPTISTAPAPVQPSVTQGLRGPVTPGQTASFDSETGATTPNQPAMQTTSTPSPVTPQDLVTAFIGESPSNMLTQLFERQKQRQQYGLEQQKQAFNEKMEPLKLAQQERLTNALTGVKSSQVAGEQASNIRNQITSLEAKKAQAIKDFPELSGTFIRGILPPGSNAKEEAAFNDYQQTQRQIDNYNRQLYSQGQGGASGGPAAHMSAADLLAIVNQSR